jgi:carbamoyl-phosphate synthase small subunit
MNNKKKALLVLEDGKSFEGRMVAGEQCEGEVVFNTSMTGYQEIITDPSYAAQIVTMTYPHIGNYGYCQRDSESRKTFAAGLIVKEFSNIYSNWRSEGSLKRFAADSDLTVVEGIDTRTLTKHIRTGGALRGVISSLTLDQKVLHERALALQPMEGKDLASEVTTEEPYFYDSGLKKENYFVIAIDFGMKTNILKLLNLNGCRVKVVPAKTSAGEILRDKPDGVFLSNGPGDPAAVGYAIKTIGELLGKVPVFGICLGHQLLSLALGAKTYKLKFGHRGANHPVKNLKTGKVEITSQNHGFAVDSLRFIESSSLRAKCGNLGQRSTNIELTHINLNDNTVEGIACPELKAFSVQYHPEASPGPHDSRYLFRQFVELMESEKSKV